MGALVDAGSLTEAQVEELLKNVRKKGKNTNTARNSRSRKEAEVGKQDNLVIETVSLKKTMATIKTMTMTKKRRRQRMNKSKNNIRIVARW